MEKQKVNPTRILIEEIKETPISKFGIIIPETAEKKSSLKGRILVAGKGTVDKEMIHKIGDIVLINPYAGTKFEWEGKDVKLIDQIDVLLNLGQE